MQTMNAVCLQGIFPPPWGGVSVHLQRLRLALEELHIPCRIVDEKRIGLDALPLYGKLIRPLRLHWQSRHALLHRHVSNLSDLLRPMDKFNSTPYKIVATFHNGRMLDCLKDGAVNIKNGLNKKNLFSELLRLDAIIVVNTDVERILLDGGFPRDRLFCIPAYIHPRSDSRASLELQEMMPFLDRPGPLICANAFNSGTYNDVPIYGIDLMLKMAEILHKTYSDLKVVFVQSKAGDEIWEHDVRQQIKDRRLQSCFFYTTTPCAFPELISRSNLFIRPTSTDGDAISIREALYLDVPVIASDCVPRPEGVFLFKNRDLTSLVDVVRNVIDNKLNASNPDKTDFFGAVLDVYRGLGLGHP